ncbi:MAG: metallopeptidase family protein [Hyphomicrobiaceae bacterium]
MTKSETDFDTIVERAFEELPDVYRDACRGLAIRTEPHASGDVLAALEVANPHELLGLYHGINLMQKSVSDLPSLPDEVILYRDPIMSYARATGRSLNEVITHVLVHEIGHHFGFSDADMELIERS